ncbi:hypothetical protein [Nonomuraea sp. NPDC023979]|uniref:hypothetical protein n=1 Tax=Nonomuraea sp. NPDC023979 TaxID=3154796 RepID=UPI0033DB5D1A
MSAPTGPRAAIYLEPTGAPDEWNVLLDRDAVNSLTIGRIMLRHDHTWQILDGHQAKLGRVAGGSHGQERAMMACAAAFFQDIAPMGPNAA